MEIQADGHCINHPEDAIAPNLNPATITMRVEKVTRVTQGAATFAAVMSSCTVEAGYKCSAALESGWKSLGV